ncbi:MAG: hypothetical protein BZY75_01600 [SAR202 cluster bacterium Io17-Chloro-G7]|nr:MAG: hypothetical protein BZY75_01600 [SAR202 cluster bacterium Io17-Chloro-G7]
MTKRSWIILGTAIPALAFIALLAWASFKSGGNPGGLGVNNEFGQVEINTGSAHGFELELLSSPIPNQDTLNFSQLRGKVVLLDFWASWCGPCRQEAATLVQVYQEYRDKDVEFVGIDIWDGRQDALNHIELFDVAYPNGIDSAGTIAIDYGVKGIPEKIFISRGGDIAKKFVGPISAPALRTVLDELLGETP